MRYVSTIRRHRRLADEIPGADEAEQNLMAVKRVRRHLAVTAAHVETTVGGVALAGKNVTALGGKRPPEPKAILSDLGGDAVERMLARRDR